MQYNKLYIYIYIWIILRNNNMVRPNFYESNRKQITVQSITYADSNNLHWVRLMKSSTFGPSLIMWNKLYFYLAGSKIDFLYNMTACILVKKKHVWSYKDDIQSVQRIATKRL